MLVATGVFVLVATGVFVFVGTGVLAAVGVVEPGGIGFISKVTSPPPQAAMNSVAAAAVRPKRYF